MSLSFSSTRSYSRTLSAAQCTHLKTWKIETYEHMHWSLWYLKLLQHTADNNNSYICLHAQTDIHFPRLKPHSRTEIWKKGNSQRCIKNEYTSVNKSHMVLPLGFLKAQMDQTMQGNQWTASFHFKGLFPSFQRPIYLYWSSHVAILLHSSCFQSYEVDCLCLIYKTGCKLFSYWD